MKKNTKFSQINYKKRRVWPSLIGGVLIVIASGVASYFVFNSLEKSPEVKQLLATTVPTDAAVMSEGQDETDVEVSAVDSYQVAADAPRVLTIDALGIRSRIMPMTVNASNAIQAPVNIFDSGWYKGSANPGTKGAALIDGHASGATRQGLFAYLDKLEPGDKITIERGSGQVLTYAVVHEEVVPLDGIDMNKALRPYGDATEGLNLITCTGTWIPSQKTYDKRVLVYAERVS
ncbi:MAG: class F sortase [Candidatus Microsaccharimonas sp.]